MADIALFDSNGADADGDGVPDDANYMIYARAYDEAGNLATVNTSSHSIGIGAGQNIANNSGSGDDNDATTSDTLTLWFAEPQNVSSVADPDTALTLQSIVNVEFELSNWHGTAGAHWVTYNAAGEIVGEGDIASGSSSFIIDLDGSNDVGDFGGTANEPFVKLELSANAEGPNDGSSFKIGAITGVTDVHGADMNLELATAQITDSDGDSAATDLHITFSGTGHLVGGDGDDAISGYHAASIDGGGGTDTLSFEADSTGIVVNLSDTTDHIENIENVTGGSGADTLIGDAEDNILLGGAGSDILDGGTGEDILYGGAGTDSITGGSGADTFGPNEESSGELTDYDPAGDLDHLIGDPEDIS
jgi:Ca2+-binding RTX toxin-like protein